MKYKIFLSVLILVAGIRLLVNSSLEILKYKAGDEVDSLRIYLQSDLVLNWSGKYNLWYEGVVIEGQTNESWPEGSVLIVSGKVNERLIKGKSSQLYLIADESKFYKSSDSMTKFTAGVKDHIGDLVRKWLPPNSAELSMGVVWGEQGYLTSETKELFRNSGLSHLLVASGFNVTLLSGMLIIITERVLRKKYSVVVNILCTSLYAFVLGMGIPVQRALVMFLVLQIGVLVGRRSNGLYTLTVLALVFIICEPRMIYSLSFLLSFLATAGLVLAPKSKNTFLSLMYQNTSIVIMTTPLLIGSFGTIQIAGIPANLLVEPIIPIISALISVAIVVGSVFPLLGKVIIYIAWPYLEYINMVATVIGGMKIVFSDVPASPWWLIILYYFGVMLMLMRRKMSLYM